jgi:fumarate reductase flavoprotein subunit
VIRDSAELHYHDTMEAGAYLGNSKLVRMLCDEAPNTISWLVDLGFQFRPELVHLGGHGAPRSHSFVGAGGGMMKTARRLLKERGIPILLRHEVVEILRDAPQHGPIRGVKVVRSGNEGAIEARKAVIVATGGFAANIPMRMKHNPFLDKKLGTTSTKYVTGDGILMGKSILADTVGMDLIQVIPRTSPAGRIDRASAETHWKMGQGAINVNRQGRRFVNCLVERSLESRSILRQKKPIFVIYDENIRTMPGVLRDMDYETMVQKGRIFRAERIEELAEQAGIDGDGLCETVAQYNGFVDAGQDRLFGRPEVKVKIERSPFYAIPSWTGVHYTMGGLLINTRTQVLDIWGNVIPGLYAAGEVTGGIHGASRLGSNALTDIWLFGRIAGKEAVSEKPRSPRSAFSKQGPQTGTDGGR